MKIDINKATAEELTQIKHVGPAFAEKIIENRPYRDIYELSTVLGLGEKRMTQIFEQGIIYASMGKRPPVTNIKEKPEKSEKTSPANFIQKLVDFTTKARQTKKE